MMASTLSVPRPLRWVLIRAEWRPRVQEESAGSALYFLRCNSVASMPWGSWKRPSDPWVKRLPLLAGHLVEGVVLLRRHPK
jgi:hypothetical protein